MESYDVFLCNNFLALGAFRAKYGDPVDDNPLNNVVATRWQSALSVSGQLGALVGVCIAGSLTSRLGYRYATLTGLMLLNVFIFAFYFAESMPVIFAAQILEGIPWGIFIANAPAYCSEIVPIQLRAPCTQMLQMFWAIGSIVVGAVTYSYQGINSPLSYKYGRIDHVYRHSNLLTQRVFLQGSDCSSMDVPHSARHSHFLRSRISLVACSKGTPARSRARRRASWAEI